MADIIIMSPTATKKDLNRVIKKVKSYGFDINLSKGAEKTIIGLIGDTREVPDEVFKILPGVSNVISILKDYKLASREFSSAGTIIKAGDIEIGGDNFTIIAGPCSVESEQQLLKTAESIKKSGAKILRGGAIKPRTSPYSFDGLGFKGLQLLMKAKKKYNIPIITEVLSPDEVEGVAEVADILQIGTRNMFNYRLLQKVGKIKKPVLLKRSFSATITEFLNCTEYILKGGNTQVILCERGIRTFETYTRNTLDLSAVLAIKKLSHLPVVVDPSHAAGLWWMVEPLAKASVAVGADGIMIEVHDDPENAKCDGQQSIKPEKFGELMQHVNAMASSLG